jgi:hypothetical protein
VISVSRANVHGKEKKDEKERKERGRDGNKNRRKKNPSDRGHKEKLWFRYSFVYLKDINRKRK